MSMCVTESTWSGGLGWVQRHTCYPFCHLHRALHYTAVAAPFCTQVQTWPSPRQNTIYYTQAHTGEETNFGLCKQIKWLYLVGWMWDKWHTSIVVKIVYYPAPYSGCLFTLPCWQRLFTLTPPSDIWLGQTKLQKMLDSQH